MVRLPEKGSDQLAALRGGDVGQALVEFVLIAPILLIVVCGLLQLALLSHTNLLVHMAVRQAAELWLQGGNERTIRSEVVSFLQQYPFLEGKDVTVRLRTSPLMATVSVECEVPVIPPIGILGQRPTVTASMSLAREIFTTSRLPTTTILDLFRRVLRGG